jgi:SAM-dependent methyltransferase
MMERTAHESIEGKSHDPFDALVREIDFQASYWADKEPVFAALCRQMADQKPHSPFARVLEITANERFERRNPRRTDVPAGGERRKLDPSAGTTRFEAKGISELAGVVRASVCNYAMRMSAEEFTYDGLDEPTAWQEILDEVGVAFLDPSRDDDKATQLEINLLGRRVQTNIAERYIPLEIILQACRQRYTNKIDWLDVGAGIMEGPRQLLLKDKYPIRVSSVETDATDVEEDLRLTQKVNQILRYPSLIENCVAVDLVPSILPARDENERDEYDPGVVRWSEASLRPSEFSDDVFMQRYRALRNEIVPGLTFQMADLSNPASMQLFEEQSSHKKFDVISFITVLHQVSRPDRKKMFEQAISMLKPGGLIVAQDFAYFNPSPENNEPSPPQHLRIYPEWFKEPFRYRTYVYDSDHPQKGLQEIFRSADSRCQRLLTGTARLAICGSLKPIRNLIDAS